MTQLTYSQKEEVLARIKTAFDELAFIPPDSRSPRLELILSLLKELGVEIEADL